MDRLIKILIIEDHEIITWSLSRIIKSNFSLVSVLSAPDFQSGISILKGGPIDLVILDIGIPGGHSTDMISKLREVDPNTRILILSGLSEKENSPRFFAAGVDGFVSKSDPLENLQSAIKVVLHNKKYISATSYEAIADSFLGKSKQPERNAIRLTDKESIVLRLMLRACLGIMFCHLGEFVEA
jgi:two-component system invasion response regulator UvrY